MPRYDYYPACLCGKAEISYHTSPGRGLIHLIQHFLLGSARAHHIVVSSVDHLRDECTLSPEAYLRDLASLHAPAAAPVAPLIAPSMF